MKNTTILLVEDNPDDEVLTLRALKKNNIGNEVVVARDGVEALDYLFCTGAFADRDPHDLPQLVLLDIKLPKVDGLEVLHPSHSSEDSPRARHHWKLAHQGRLNSRYLSESAIWKLQPDPPSAFACTRVGTPDESRCTSR